MWVDVMRRPLTGRNVRRLYGRYGIRNGKDQLEKKEKITVALVARKYTPRKSQVSHRVENRTIFNNVRI